MGRRSPLAYAPRPATSTLRQVRVNDKVKAVAGPIVLATDASVGGPDRVASGYLSTTGHTGLRAHLYPKYLVRPHSRVVVTELRAVYGASKRSSTRTPAYPSRSEWTTCRRCGTCTAGSRAGRTCPRATTPTCAPRAAYPAWSSCSSSPNTPRT